MNKYAMLIDPSKCIGCNLCVEACEKAHGGLAPASYYTWIIDLKGYAGLSYAPVHCLHCEDPPCVKACPSGAMRKLENGAVIVDHELCIGCSFCISSCPFNRIHYDPESRLVYKCDLCYERIGGGKKPACVEACPYEAKLFGDYEEMLKIGKERAEKLEGGLLVYPGETVVLYVLTRDQLNLLKAEYVLEEAYPSRSRSLMDLMKYSRIGAAVLFAGSIIYFVNWRKKRMSKISGGEG